MVLDGLAPQAEIVPETGHVQEVSRPQRQQFEQTSHCRSVAQRGLQHRCQWPGIESHP
jgi:hypothetical protein